MAAGTRADRAISGSRRAPRHQCRFARREADATLDDHANTVIKAKADTSGRRILVAHSAGGTTIPLVAARAPVDRMVFAAAILPQPAQSIFEALAPGLLSPRRGLPRSGAGSRPGTSRVRQLLRLIRSSGAGSPKRMSGHGPCAMRPRAPRPRGRPGIPNPMAVRTFAPLASVARRGGGSPGGPMSCAGAGGECGQAFESAAVIRRDRGRPSGFFPSSSCLPSVSTRGEMAGC